MMKAGYRRIEGDLPNGWKEFSLEKATKEIEEGGTPPTKKKECFGGDIPWVVVEDIVPEIVDTREHLTGLGLKHARLWPKNTVILSFGATIGNVGIARVPLATKQGIAGLVANPEVTTPEFLYYLLENNTRLLVRYSHKSTIAEIRPPTLRQLFFGFAPMPEQERIVATLSNIDLAIKDDRTAWSSLLELRRSLLEACFEAQEYNKRFRMVGIAQITKQWKGSQLSDYYSKDPQNGLYKPESYYGEGTQIVRIDDFYDGHFIRTSGFQRVRLSDDEVSTYLLRPRDIVVNRVNSISFLGKSALVPAFGEPAVFESNMMRLTFDERRLLPEFAILWLSTSFAIRYLKRRAKRAVAQASINQTDVGSLPIVDLGLEQQQRIVKVFSRLDAGIDSCFNHEQALLTLKSGMARTMLSGASRFRMM